MCIRGFSLTVVVIQIMFILFTFFDARASEIHDGLLAPRLALSLDITDYGIDYMIFGKSIISQITKANHDAIYLKDIPDGAEIVKAILYWAGELKSYKSADADIELKTSDGKTFHIYADKVWTNVLSGLVYVSRADITEYVLRDRRFTVSYIETDPLEPATSLTGDLRKYHTVGGWAIVCIYKKKGRHYTQKSHIKLWDGLLLIRNGERVRAIKPDILKSEFLLSNTLELGRFQTAKSKTAVLDVGIVCGFGKPWNGGSIFINGIPLTGREDFVGNAGFCWDVIRGIVNIDPFPYNDSHRIEFVPDYDTLMPIVLVVKNGEIDQDDIVALANSYISQAELIERLPYYDKTSSHFLEREYQTRAYIKDILYSYAVKLYRRLKDLPNFRSLHLRLGELYLKRKRYRLAEVELKKSAILDNNPNIYKSLAQLYYETGQIERSIHMLKKALRLNPNDITSRLNLGVCFMQKGNLKEARKQFELIRIYQPKNLFVLNALYEIYMSMNESEKADYIQRKIYYLRTSKE